MPFEQLLQTEVITADKLARQISDAPSAVSIVTAEDIRTYGYRTLSDILDSMRGLAMAHDGEYGYLSGRGYGNPGSSAGYAGRITLLIDGYRAPDNLFGQAYFGQDAFLDVELIERVEYIPGSGSSSYGDSAFLGVINVITKKGRDIGGVQVATVQGEHGFSQNRVTAGGQLDGGLELLLSASTMHSRGRVIPADVAGYDGALFENDRNSRYFLKAAYRGWTLESALVDRWQPLDARRISDISSFGRVRYDGDLATDLKASVDLYYGRYRYRETYNDPELQSWSGGDWRGVDAKLVGTRFDHHTIVAGVEYRDDFKQGYWNTFSQSFTSRRTASVYVYDDIAVTDRLNLNLGGRRDARNDHGSTFSPRRALIYTPVEGTTLKLSSGKAHRQMTADGESWYLNHMVERVATRELVWEQMLGRKTRLVGSVYRYRIENYEAANGEAIYDADGNFLGFAGIFSTINTKGAEVELEHLWDNGARLRTSYARQETRDQDGSMPANMARHIGKFNASMPVLGEHLRVGLGTRYLGRRLNLSGEYEPAVAVADLTLSGKWRDWSSSFSVRNVGNTSYNEVSGVLFSSAGIYPAARRSCWFQLEYTFR